MPQKQKELIYKIYNYKSMQCKIKDFIGLRQNIV